MLVYSFFSSFDVRLEIFPICHDSCLYEVNKNVDI